MEMETELSDFYCTDTLFLDKSDDEDENVLLQSGRCFICNHNSADSKECFRFLFDDFVDLKGNASSAAAILSSALGVELTENNAKTQLLCQKCFDVLLEFEQVEQQLNELRQRILGAYNHTAALNNWPVIDETYSAGQDDASLNSQQQIANKIECALYEAKNENDSSNAVDNATQFCYENIITQSVDDLIEHSVVEHDEEHEANATNWQDATVDSVVDTSGKCFKTNEKVEKTDVTDTANLANDANSNNEVANKIYNNLVKVEPEEDTEVHFEECNMERPIPVYKQQDNLFECFCCENADAMNETMFAQHVKTVHFCNAYTCGCCGNGFFDAEQLNSHINLLHLTENNDDEFVNDTKIDSVQCKQCKSSFQTFNLLRVHVRQKHANNTKHYECTICARKCSSKNLLEEHLNSHSGKKPHKCHVCSKAFTSKYIMQTHLKIHTKRERPFQCDTCGKNFLTQQNLRQHAIMHVRSNEFICHECDKEFSSQHALNMHGVVHSGVKPFNCDECGKSFARRAEIQDHQRIHTGERPWMCDICYTAFAQRSNLMTHKKSTHLNERQHVCSICQRAFKRRRLLDFHIKSAHTGERPHKCKVCETGFVYPEHLKKHERIHSGIKPFKCEVCNKAFSSRENRNAHRFVHSSKKPYECSECGNGFMRKQQLMAHLKRTAHNSNTSITNRPQVGVTLDNDCFDAQFIEIDEDAST